jgi:spore germination cell wall hydrolase CwlJ-like protein
MKAIFLLLFTLLLSLSSSLGATYGQKMVAAVLLAEARGDGKRGMTAVAEVIRTRADSKAWSKSPLAVIQERKQFSSVNGTTVGKLHAKMQKSRLYPVALRISRTMYNTPEKLPGYAQGATHFARYDANPYWALGRKPVARVGQHLFYKL